MEQNNTTYAFYYFLTRIRWKETLLTHLYTLIRSFFYKDTEEPRFLRTFAGGQGRRGLALFPQNAQESRERSMRRILFLLLIAAWGAWPARAEGGRPFRVEGGRACLVMDADEDTVVQTAAMMLRRDWQAVFGRPLGGGGGAPRIVAGTAGRSRALRRCGVDLRPVEGRRQAFLLVVDAEGTLVVAGSDRHGTAYGLLEVSRRIGVSPWEWWADAAPRRLEHFELPAGFLSAQWPSVEYRGIFINDEDWGFTPWSCRTHDPAPEGVVGKETTERVCELLLRLRANTYWPPMHECTHPFFLTPGNRDVARRYGIYIGSSHCEPLACSAATEWGLRGEGAYDYVHNAEAVRRFWEERVEEVAGQDIIYTLGMRGVHDGAMQGASSVGERLRALQRILKDQRGIIAHYVSRDTDSVPQVFIPYKEVLDVYDAGLQVPDGVTLVWCDDNYGYIRRFPSPAERLRRGGHGLYYHASYWGRPHDYLWLGTFSPALMLQQLAQAYRNGIQKLWVLNVGDIKPLEYQTELFMDLAWDTEGTVAEGTARHLARFLAREFGPAASRLTPALLECYRLSFARKPEHLANTRTEERDSAYRQPRDLPWGEGYVRDRLSRFRQLSQEVRDIGARISADRRDTYFQLVQYPVEACALMNEKWLTAQLARHGLADFAAADSAHNRIQRLTRRYNTGFQNGGKWNFMMDCQPRRLPVFAPVPHTRSAAPLPSPAAPRRAWSGADCETGAFTPWPWLGREGKAVELLRDSALTFRFTQDSSPRDTAEVELRVLPTHPLTLGGQLRLAVTLDGGTPAVVSFETQGRSEEWKENVLRNQAVRVVRLPLRASDTHVLRLRPLDPGILLDQVLLR